MNYDKLLIDNFELWKKANDTNDKALKKEVQTNTLPFHKSKCDCTINAVMNKLKYAYSKMGLIK